MHARSGWFLALSLCSLVSCSKIGGHAAAPILRHVSLEVEVYDPISGYVWQGVGVRLLDATTEWSGLTIPNIQAGRIDYTDAYGTVYFDETDLADAQMGFAIDPYGRAVLDPDPLADEAWITVEVSSPGFPTVLATAYLSWDAPHCFVSIPFVPSP